MSETETRPPLFNRERNYQDFRAFRGFHPQESEWVPVMPARDFRDNRDPAPIGKRVMGKKHPLAAADKYASRTL